MKLKAENYLRGGIASGDIKTTQKFWINAIILAEEIGLEDEGASFPSTRSFSDTENIEG